MTPTSRPRAVIFDMDGLMLDTEPLAARAWTDAAGTAGIAFDCAVTPQLVGRTFGDCRTLIMAHHGAGYPVDALMAAWHDAYDAIVDREGIALKPGLIALLDWLDSARIPRAVATSTRHARACVKLERAALLERFVAVVGGDQVAQGKPAPDIFLAAAERLQHAPYECLVLEDSIPGLEAAARAGMPAIGIPDGHAPAVSLAGPGRLVLRTLDEVRTHLTALPAWRCDNPPS